MARASLLPAMKGLGPSPRPPSYTVRGGEEKGDLSTVHRAVARPAAHGSHRHWGQEAADEVSESWGLRPDGSHSKTLPWAHRVQASLRCGANRGGFVHSSPKKPGCVTPPNPSRRFVKWIEDGIPEDPFLNPELMKNNPWVEKGKCSIL